MHEVILAFGSNLGDRYLNIKNALRVVNCLPGTKVVKISKIYETEPIDVPNTQNFYLNCCAVVETDYDPNTFLGFCLGVETTLGRRRPYKNASRIIDIDLIMYDDIEIRTKKLTLPHALWSKRLFVLIPLLDLCRNGKINKFNIRALLQSCEKSDVKAYDAGGIKLLEKDQNILKKLKNFNDDAS